MGFFHPDMSYFHFVRSTNRTLNKGFDIIGIRVIFRLCDVQIVHVMMGFFHPDVSYFHFLCNINCPLNKGFGTIRI